MDDVTIVVRVPGKLAAAFKAACARDGFTMSAILRAFVAEYVERSKDSGK